MTLQTTGTPEDRELAHKMAELGQLERELSDAELALVTVRTDLGLFERRYLRVVGVRVAELDEIEATILRQRSRDSADAELLARARAANDRAEESKRAASGAVAEEMNPKVGAQTDELRQLYREIARRVHPDLAPDESTRVIRAGFMSRANSAYSEGDLAALHKLFDEWSSRPEEVAGESVGAQLVRAIRRIAQARARLRDIEAELATLAASPMTVLKRDAEAAETAGRDLLSDMAERLDAEIGAARARLRRAAATR